MVTILIYAVFTGLAALSSNWWQLAVYRFLTALGIGGEWAAGAALVAEVWPDAKRAKAAGVLQSAWAVGFLIAAVVSLLMRERGWRSLFVVGSGGLRPVNWSNGRAAFTRESCRSFSSPSCSAPRWLVPGSRSSPCSGYGARPTGRQRWSGRCPNCKDWTPVP